MPSTIKFKIGRNGAVKIDARGMIGTADEILAQLTDLATATGGELKVERHEPGMHDHHHADDHVHDHVHIGGSGRGHGHG